MKTSNPSKDRERNHGFEELLTTVIDFRSEDRRGEEKKQRDEAEEIDVHD